jgi:enoyl reductase
MWRSMRRTGGLLAAAALAATLLPAGTAHADGFDPQPSVRHDNNTYVPRIVVTVSRNGVRSSAVTTSAPSTSYAHPPCWYFPSWEGPELFDYYDSGQANRDARHYDDGQRWDPPAGYQDHRNDGLDKGQWWSGMCSSEYWPDESIRAFMDYAEQWFDGHPTIWVAAGEPNPNAAALVIPPEVLVHIAEDFLTLPAPTLAHNPTGNSVVNLPTWVWATDESFAEQRVRAQFGANWAEVIARPVGLRLSVDGPARVDSDCPDGGTPYRRGAATRGTSCSVTFLKSARARTVSATLVWDVHWEGSDGTNEPLDPPVTPEVGSFTTQVDEVQTVVDGAPAR